MKVNNLHRWSILTCLLLSVVACEDEFSSPSSHKWVNFSIENVSGMNVISRSSSGSDSLLSSRIIPLEAKGVTLYLHTTVADSINGSRLGKDEFVTRATPVNDLSTYGSFSVFAAFYQGAWSPGSQNLNFMYNVPVSLSGAEWSPQTNYYWPGSGKVRFYAYAPIDAEFEASNQNKAANDFYIKYEVPTDVSKQKDLLIAKSEEYPGNYKARVSLKFKHVLTAVRFVVGEDMKAGTVNKVRLRNITSAGTYNPETGYVGKLEGTGVVKDFEQELNKMTNGTPGDAITGHFQTFMLPPQDFTDDSSIIEVVFTDDKGEHTLSASLKGQKWNSGTTVTYKISTSSINWDYILEVSGINYEFPVDGGSQWCNVNCYRSNSKGVSEFADWTTEFSTDNGASWTANKPDWLTNFETTGNGLNRFPVTVGAQEASVELNLHTAALKAATQKGSALQPYNLSNSAGGVKVENTANCYVVGAPGYYSFPLVYGNAIKNSVTNTSAYVSSVISTNGNLINHTGKGITDPYIGRNAGCFPAKAELVWQDALSLVSDIKYIGSNNGSISFKVDRGTIQQGNAVIAIKDVSGTVLWSWHIWVTDEDINKTIEVTNAQNKKYKLMSVNLGWCDGVTATYAGRSCIVKFIAGGKSETKIIKQKSGSITNNFGNNPYYQWGRKDPLLPSDGSVKKNYLDDGTTKTWYDKSGVSSTSNPPTGDLSTDAVWVKNCILNPNIMDKKQYTNQMPHLWNINNNYNIANYDMSVIKTIYDPSPVGFRVPSVDTFTGFLTDDGVNKSSPNGFLDKSKLLFHFYTNSSKRETIIFPFSAYRSVSGSVVFTGMYGYCWTAAPKLESAYVCYYSTQNYVAPMTWFGKGNAYPVRSCKE